MFVVLSLLACAIPAENLLGAYIEAYCEHASACASFSPTMDECIAAMEELVTPPADGCTLDRTSVEACLESDVVCVTDGTFEGADPCMFYTDTVDDRNWDCPAT